MMRKIVYIITMCLTMGVFSSCTQYNLDDTGLVNGKHDTTMWEYLKGDSYNWDSLHVTAEHADLVSLFQGTSQHGKNFTFSGPTNHSIRHYLYGNHMGRMSNIPVADCKKFILNSVLLNERMILDDFKEGVKSFGVSTPIGKGDEIVEMAFGKQLWIYTSHESYNGVPAASPLRIHLALPITIKTSDVASCNIETNTGVVHSLVYDLSLTNF